MGFLTIFRYYIEKFLLNKNFLNRIKFLSIFFLQKHILVALQYFVNVVFLFKTVFLRA